MKTIYKIYEIQEHAFDKSAFNTNNNGLREWVDSIKWIDEQFKTEEEAIEYMELNLKDNEEYKYKYNYNWFIILKTYKLN